MTREQAPQAGAVHNMSAPPRSTVDLRPLRPGAVPVEEQIAAQQPAGTGSSGAQKGARGKGSSGAKTAAPGSGPSGTFFARVHLVGLLCDGRSHVPRGGDIARGIDGLPHDLIDAVAMLRTGRGRGKRVASARLACAELPLMVLHDEFLDRVDALGDTGLPALLLARPINLAVAASRLVPPLVALRLIAGTAGGAFLRARAPSAAHLLGCAVGIAFDYYLPRGMAAQEESR